MIHDAATGRRRWLGCLREPAATVIDHPAWFCEVGESLTAQAAPEMRLIKVNFQRFFVHAWRQKTSAEYTEPSPDAILRFK